MKYIPNRVSSINLHFPRGVSASYIVHSFVMKSRKANANTSNMRLNITLTKTLQHPDKYSSLLRTDLSSLRDIHNFKTLLVISYLHLGCLAHLELASDDLIGKSVANLICDQPIQWPSSKLGLVAALG